MYEGAVCWLYNITTNVWTSEFPQLPLAMYAFAMITLEGRPFVCGGCVTFDIYIVKSVYVYTFDTSMWVQCASMRA